MTECIRTRVPGVGENRELCKHCKFSCVLDISIYLWYQVIKFQVKVIRRIVVFTTDSLYVEDFRCGFEFLLVSLLFEKQKKPKYVNTFS